MNITMKKTKISGVTQTNNTLKTMHIQGHFQNTNYLLTKTHFKAKTGDKHIWHVFTDYNNVRPIPRLKDLAKVMKRKQEHN